MDKTCPCGQTFTPTRHQKYCPACREMRHNARQPQVKPCNNCGTPTRNRRQRKPYCSVCSAEAARKLRDAKRAKRDRDAYEQQKEDYLRQLEQSPEEVQRQHFFVALGWLINLVLGEHETPAPPIVEEVPPDQVPADDQDAIDATFREIMASVNW